MSEVYISHNMEGKLHNSITETYTENMISPTLRNSLKHQYNSIMIKEKFPEHALKFGIRGSSSLIVRS